MAGIVAYSIPNKNKARWVLKNFVHGAIANGIAAQLELFGAGQLIGKNTAAAFFGVNGQIEHLWRQAIAEEREWYWLDNAYFDQLRDFFFRCSKNRLQSEGKGKPDHKRAAWLGLQVENWRADGHKVVVVCQSPWHMQKVCGIDPHVWLAGVRAELARSTDRPVVVRPWTPYKKRAIASFRVDLKHAWAVVTHTSAAANEAILCGVPAFCTGSCAASPLASSDLSQIENPPRPAGRHDWVATLAAQMWTPKELREGDAMRALERRGEE